LTGTPRRRRWSAEEKAAIVAESRGPGAVARRVALRHGLHPNQLYAWRRELGSGSDGEPMPPGFVPVAMIRSARSEATGSPVGTIEIEVAGALVRVASRVEPGFLCAVLRAVKAA
jgi:transposase